MKLTKVTFALIILFLILTLIISKYSNSIFNVTEKGVLLERIKSVLAEKYQLFSYEIYFKHIESNYWIPENESERVKLDLFKYIKAAKTEELTLSNGAARAADYSKWHRSHGDNYSTRYSNLTQIDSTNVHELEVAWQYWSGSKKGNIQSNPVIAEGILYSPTGNNDIVALNAQTGIEIWKYSPPSNSFPARRGLIYWPGDSDSTPRIYFPAGSMLIALDAASGKPIGEFGKAGIVEVGNTGKIAPTIAGGKIIHATMRPSLTAFDLISGEKLWDRYLLEAGQQPTQGGRPFKLKGGNPWGGMALDPERGIAYITTGDPTPILVGTDRPGRNQHANSLIAIDTNNGNILWSFQEVRHDIWDLDIPTSPILTTIVRNGLEIDVVVAITKLGNTLLLDRVTGKPIFDFRLKRAPVSTLPGEKTWPYQPSLILPEPFAKQEFSLDDLTDIGIENYKYVSNKVKYANFGFFTPHKEGIPTVFYGLHGGAEWSGGAVDPENNILYVSSNQVAYTVSVVNVGEGIDESKLPETVGRRTYLATCVNCHGINREGGIGPSLIKIAQRMNRDEILEIITNGYKSMPPQSTLDKNEMFDLLDYLTQRDSKLNNDNHNSKSAKNYNFVRTKYKRLTDFEGFPGSKPPWGLLNAIDLNTGKILWAKPLGEYQTLTERGIPITGTENFGGPSVTAGGLVFVAGTLDKKIRAFDKLTGEVLWSHELPFGGFAPPSIYEVNGEQYVVIPATGGGTLKRYYPNVQEGDVIVAFKLKKH